VSRFLFVVPPLHGHVNPAAAVARALAAGGHSVAWAGPESFLRPVLGDGALIFRTGMRMYRGIDATGTTDIRAFFDGYVTPLARFTLGAVDAAAREFAPDVVVCDQHGVAGALVARRYGLPWATLIPNPLGLSGGRAPEIDAWVAGPLAELWRAADLPDVTDDERRGVLLSPYLQVGFTTAEISGAVAPDGPVVLVGPALAAREGEPAFPVDRLDPTVPCVLVTTGTTPIEGSDDFLRRVVAALGPLAGRTQAIVLAPPDQLRDPPPHVSVVARTDVLALMPHLQAVVCHGGFNTAVEALWHGVPLVVAPARLDQPVVADLVVRAGAGVRVDFGRSGPEELREAVLTVLTEPGYRAAARAVGASFAASGGAEAAAAHIIRLAPTERDADD
jgi:UDP:flavonoid glycosyltransferase YjiC (YdhE family)